MRVHLRRFHCCWSYIKSYGCGWDLRSTGVGFLKSGHVSKPDYFVYFRTPLAQRASSVQPMSELAVRALASDMVTETYDASKALQYTGKRK